MTTTARTTTAALRGDGSIDDNDSADDNGGLRGDGSIDDDNSADDNGRTNDNRSKNAGEVYGKVGQMPQGTLIGKWVVDGKTYLVTAQTEINHRPGAVVQGTCLKVHLNADGVTVRELEIEPSANCAVGG